MFLFDLTSLLSLKCFVGTIVAIKILKIPFVEPESIVVTIIECQFFKMLRAK